jgi:peroxiredoxin
MKHIFTGFILSLTLAIQLFAQGNMNAKMTGEKIVSPEEAAKSALNVGAMMPKFKLADAFGKTVSSNDLLKKGNLVIVFYRGAWCPFCNTYLHSLQKNLAEIKANNGNLVAISVENADKSMAVAKKNELTFTVLSDPKLMVAKKFGIVFELPKETNEKYISYGLDLVKANGTPKPELPLSATYIVNRKGKILYAYLEPDYKKRAELAEILQILAQNK